MRTICLSVIIVCMCVHVEASEPTPLDRWLLPDSKELDRMSPALKESSKNEEIVQTVTFHGGQFVSDRSFTDVVDFYATASELNGGGRFSTQSGRITGIPFSTSSGNSQTHKSTVDIYGKKPSVTVLHSIRDNHASATFLVTEDRDAGNVVITITRSKDDEQTLIQIIQHPISRIDRSKFQASQ